MVEQQRLSQGVKTRAEVLEKLRTKLIICQRDGKNLMINIGKTQPDFCTEFTSADVFPSNLVFDYAEWHKRDTHMAFVKEEERQNDEVMPYELHPEFTLMIVSTCETEADISAQLAKIPHSA